MSFAGSTLQSISFRSAPLIGTPPVPASDPGHPPMRRGLARLGCAVLAAADGCPQLSLLQRLTGPCQQCLGTLMAAGRSRLPAVGLLPPPRAYGSRPKSKEAPPALAAPYEPVDKALLSARRNAEEAKRLAKNYDLVSPAQMRRARQAAMGLGPPAGLLPGAPGAAAAGYYRALPPPPLPPLPPPLDMAPPAPLPPSAPPPQYLLHEPQYHQQQQHQAHLGTGRAFATLAHPPQGDGGDGAGTAQPQDPLQQLMPPPLQQQQGTQAAAAAAEAAAEAEAEVGGSLSDYLSAVLWDGHVRMPEQTDWAAEASTSAAAVGGGGGGGDGGGGGRGAVGGGLLGGRRHKAGSRADSLAVARRTGILRRQQQQLQQQQRKGTARTPYAADGLAAPPPPPPTPTPLSSPMTTAPTWPLPYAVDVAAAAEPPPPPPQQQDELLAPHVGVVDESPPAPKPRKKRAARKQPSEGEAAAATDADLGASASATSLDSSDAALLFTTRRVRRKRPPAAAADAVPVAAESAPPPLPPPPIEDVKPYLQPGLLPLVPPVPLAGHEGSYFWSGCEGYVSRQPLMGEEPEDVLIVNTPEVARAVVSQLFAVADSPYPNNRVNPPVPCRYFGCDTEVAFIDVTSETPIGHGAVLCFSIYGGDDLDFSDCAAAAVTHGSVGAAASGPLARKDRIWVDVWGEVELDEAGRPIMEGRYVRLKPHHPILAEFKRFFEDDSVKKVWHNYGFDRHVLENMGILCAGFGGDTLHMARLADASRNGRRTYGLDNLTADKDIMRHFTPLRADKPQRELTGAARRAARRGAAPPAAMAAAAAPVGGGGGVGGSSPGDQRVAELAKLVRAKVSMKERFGLIKVRSGVPGKVPEMADMHHLHSLPLFRPTWIDYSALDAKATWQLREALECLLRSERWELEESLARRLGYEGGAAAGPATFLHLWHFYCSYWLDFGELLTEMERRGMMVNRGHLAEAQRRAEADKEAALREFLHWADSKVPGARYMNPSSGLQIRMLLFPDYPGLPTKAAAVEANKAKAAAERAAAKLQQQQQRGGAGGGGGGGAGAAAPAAAAGGGESDGGEGEGAATPSGSRIIKVPNPDYEKELASGNKKASRYRSIELYGIWGKGVPGRLQPELLTATNAAAVSIRVLRGLAGKPGAARKELAKLLEARAAAEQEAESRAAAAAEAAAAAAAAERVPIVGDALDDTLQEISGAEDGGNGGGNGGGEEEGEEELAESALPPTSRPAPVVDDPERLAALEKEAKDKGLGRLYAACGGGEEGLRACIAVEALCEISAIEKLLSAFIIPLQSDGTSTTTLLPAAPGTGSGSETGSDSPPPTRAVHRVHCSLNINTETGRLSARRPNLQNQPALEKDRYRVRRAFTADVASGNTLVVADYGQLELRILAHMTNCESMKEAFILGGDFHSRTAYGMYDYIQEAVRNGECYLEWEGQGEPDKPLVKDKFASERRKAKVLNFSIAYGKTAHGLAADFKTSKEEAQETVDKWYSDRWEVRKWQEDTRRGAREEGKVRTLLGRTRPLPNINSPDFKLSGHSNRAAINTPIQGSAADVAAAAMVAIHKSEALRATGFKLLMQIHDEVILEGPRERSDAAKRLVMQLMANPWDELARHWNAPGATGLMQGPGWHRTPPGGHLAGVWRYGGGVGMGIGAAAGGAEAAQGGGGGGDGGDGGSKGGEGGGAGEVVMPLLVELATDCNVADTWYEAK